jgi:hypothetical protein
VPCSSLTASGSVTTSSAGQVIENLNIAGTLTIQTPDVIVRNVCVTSAGSGVAADGSIAVQVLNGAKDTLIENTTITAPNNTTAGLDLGIKNWSSEPATLSRDYISNCGECVHDGPWTVKDSYVIANVMLSPGPRGSEHTEDVYYDDNVPGPVCHVRT